MRDLRVVELSRSVAGAYCGKLMAGFGARVVQILPPDGAAPDWNDAEEAVWFNTGKTRAALRPGQARQQLEALIAGTDIVLDAWGAGVLNDLGLDAQRLQQLNPRLILCRITPFGQSGPYRDFQASDIVLYAMSGMMHSTGESSREPLNSRTRISQLTAGLNAYIACAMALLRRERDGIGEVIDLSIHESSMENIETHLAEQAALGKTARRNNDTPPMVPWRTYPCADGEAAIIGGPIRNWLKAAPLFGKPELMGADYAEMGARMQHRADFEALLKPWLGTQTRQQVMKAGQAKGMAWSYVATLPEALEDPQHEARGYFTVLDQPGLGRYQMPGAPFRGPDLRWTDAPAPERDTPMQDLLRDWASPRISASTASDPAAPLAGMRVLDFTHDWAGPHAARVLADYGAEVIKVEYPKRLDGMRGGYKDKLDAHPRFWQLHRGKRSLTLDLKIPEHRAVCEALLRDTDLVIENSRAGVMKRKGLGYDKLKALNPRISLISMSAFGATGPYSAYAGYGGTIEAISGLQSLTGYDASGPGLRVREMDVINGIFGACAAMTALWQRQSSGKGQWIDLSETETCSWMMGEFIMRTARDGQPPERIANRDEVFAPQGCYGAAGNDRWLVLSVRSDTEWHALATLIGGAALDARYATVEGRRAGHDELDALLAAWTRTQDARELALKLQAHKLAAGWVMSAADLVDDDHLKTRGWFQRTPGGDLLPGFPFTFANGGAQIRRGRPDLGKDNAELFAACGFDDALPDLAPDKLGTAYDP